MSNDLTISLNEFRALLRKVFEGIYGHAHDWNALADLVLWLEYRGFSGLEILFAAEPHLCPKDRVQIKRSESGEIIVEAGGGSALSICLEVGDLLIAEAKRDGRCVLHIKDTFHPEIIAATVNRCAISGLAAAAWWPGVEEWGAITFQNPGDKQPNLYRIELPRGFEGYKDVTVIADKSLENIKNGYPAWFSFLKSGQLPSSEIDDLYLHHLDNGYRISLKNYKKLTVLADRVLVEATEQSRHGAGE